MWWRAVIVLLVACLTHAADWTRIAERDGVLVEGRDTEGSPIRELRLTTHSPLEPDAILRTLWRPQEWPEFIPYVKRVDVLRDDGDTRLVYEQIHIPIVKDRDLTLRVIRLRLPDGGYQMSSVAVPEGPPETRDYVRVKTNESRWQLVPDAGGTAVTYSMRTDPGGWYPAWIMGIAQREISVTLVRAMLDRALQNESKGR